MNTSGVSQPNLNAASRKNLFRLRDVYRIYGQEPVAVHALDGVSLDIHAGDFMAIIGPSGSGKSTLLGLLGCLDLPTKGSIKVDLTFVKKCTKDIFKYSKRKKINVKKSTVQVLKGYVNEKI